MNMSKVVSSIKMQLGLYAITLPFKDDTGKTIPAENVILDVLKTTTIPIYSTFVPWVRECEIPVRRLKVINERQHVYQLPASLIQTPILYVLEVDMPIRNTRGTYGDIAPAYGINRSVQGVVTSQAYMMVAGQMRAEPTFEYMGDNKVKLYGFPKTDLVFKVACEHEPNGETIPDTCFDSFLSLAKLDVKMFLYNTLKLYDGIPTAFGQIQLKIDDYSSAEADREVLLDKFRDTFHVDMMDYVQWM